MLVSDSMRVLYLWELVRKDMDVHVIEHDETIQLYNPLIDILRFSHNKVFNKEHQS